MLDPVDGLEARGQELRGRQQADGEVGAGPDEAQRVEAALGHPAGRGDQRVGALDTVFFDTLLDENAASHIALGHAYQMCVDESEADKVNDSTIHVDFMIGSPEVRVLGLDAAGGETPVLVEGAWQV